MSLNDKNEVYEVFQNLAENTLRSIKNIKIKEVKISWCSINLTPY